MRLTIDTTDMQKTTIRLLEGEKGLVSLEKANSFGSQVTLPMIEEALHKVGKNLKDLKSIVVNEGPGSYTGTRVGVAIANALSYLLQIPVNGKLPPKELAQPKYN